MSETKSKINTGFDSIRSNGSAPSVIHPVHPEYNEASGDVRRMMVLFGLTALLTLVLDQLSKWWIRQALSVGGEMPVLPGWMHFTHTLNHGAAWGALSGQRFLLIVVSLVVIGIIFWLAREIAARGKIAILALGLILGGAIGNLIDRTLQGPVTDFIDLDTPIEWLRTFPVFNIADSALTVGVALLIVQWLWSSWREETQMRSAES